jgi:hypothetical protein
VKKPLQVLKVFGELPKKNIGYEILKRLILVFSQTDGFGLCVGGLLKPKTVCQHQSLLIAQMLLFVLSAH